MGRTTEQQREYMRRYRARKRAAEARPVHQACDQKISEQHARIEQLEAEVKRLRAGPGAWLAD